MVLRARSEVQLGFGIEKMTLEFSLYESRLHQILGIIAISGPAAFERYSSSV
jgi:hypothetical protein